MTSANSASSTDRSLPKLGGLGGDEAHLSIAGGKIAQSAASLDVRLDKVASIQSAIEAGTYQIPAVEVAKKLISSLLSPEDQGQASNQGQIDKEYK